MQNYEILEIAGLRVDGRKPEELRIMKHNLGFVKSSDGSAYYEQGLNKVLVMVHGPQEPSKRQHSEQAGEKGSIACQVVNTPYSGTEKKRRRMADRRTLEVEAAVRQVAEEVVQLDLYPRSEILVVVHVLESDGSVLCAIINAMSLALMDGGIAMSDMPCACSIGHVNKSQLSLDVTQVEINSGGAYIPVVMKARSEEIIFMQLDSRLSIELLEDALLKCTQGCRKVKVYVEAAIRQHMISKAGLSSKR